MSQTNSCNGPKLEVPVCGLKLSLDKSAFDGIGGGGVGEGIDWSTEEQWTGRHWIDGNKVYQKTITLEGLPSKNIRYYPHNIENVDQFISFVGLWLSSDGEFRQFPNVGTADVAISLMASPANFSIKTYSSHSFYPQAKAAITFQYTCTDR